MDSVNGKPATQRLKEYADKVRLTIGYAYSKDGPDHCPTYTAHVTVNDGPDHIVAQSQGRDRLKKVASNTAALNVLILLKESQPPEHAARPERSDSFVSQEEKEPESSREHTRRPDEQSFLPEAQPCLFPPENQSSDERPKPPVSALQELCQQKRWKVTYNYSERHRDLTFTASCYVTIPVPVYKAGTVGITFKAQGSNKAKAKEAAALKVYDLAVFLSNYPGFVSY